VSAALLVVVALVALWLVNSPKEFQR